MSAPSSPCGECGEWVAPTDFHDYVECIRQRARTMPRSNRPFTAIAADIDSLLAYIDSKEPARSKT